MATVGTHFQGRAGRMDVETTFPVNPDNGQNFFDPTTNTHYIYAGGQWWGHDFTTSTSTSTTTTSTSTTSSTTTSTSSSTTTTSTSTSTTV